MKSRTFGFAMKSIKVSRRAGNDEPPNLFEIRVNKRKHDVLGRKLKSERSARGKATCRALEKRKKTLLPAYQQRSKRSLFIDGRLGEHDNKMTVEEKMFKRFAAERQRQHEHEQRHINFSLEEESSDLEKSFSKKIPLMCETEIDDHKLKEEDFKEAHFGGFDANGSDKLYRSQQEIMEDVIAKAKKKKFERQRAKDLLSDLTDKLDSDWPMIKKLMSHGQASGSVTDDYDVTVKQLAFDGRAQSSEATKTVKTDAEILKRRKKEEKRQEISRDSRIRHDKTAWWQYASTDALNEDLNFDCNDKQKGEVYLTSNVIKDSEGSDDKSVQDETESLQSEGGSSFNSCESEQNFEVDRQDKEGESQSESSSSECINSTEEEFITCHQENEDQESHDQFWQLIEMLNEKSSKDNNVKAVEMVANCLCAKKSLENKRKLEVLFVALVRRFRQLCCEPMTDIHQADQLTKVLYNMSHIVAHVAGDCMKNTVREIQRVQGARKSASVLTMSQLLVLRLCGVLFPVSGYHHTVVTPAITLLASSLSQCEVTSCCEAFLGLFSLSVLHQFVCYSKKFVPEVPLFLSHLFSTVLMKLSSFSNEELDRDKLWKIRPMSLGELVFGTFEESTHTWFSVLYIALTLLALFGTLYASVISFPKMFQILSQDLYKLSSMSLPLAIQRQVCAVSTQLKTAELSLYPLRFQHHKPTPLKLYTPRFEQSFYDSQSSRRNDTTQLRLKHRKELRGAVRELRRDAAFLSYHSLKDQLERDEERRRHVKALQNMLASEQAETKERKRKARI
ncbi:nucleolar protein 14-like isoform X2 [Corticium candelabrum]|uniref:nucleolar protein 14-like isoform X2 n=1 Tax=Corticium candelabrum TaxID=121492 RepID=UPI002E264872|nr:nucleolar protein 14-like isoform X2 [Corticium candelabrum]